MEGIRTEEIALDFKERRSNSASRNAKNSIREYEEDGIVEGEIIHDSEIEKVKSDEDERNSRIFCNRVIVCMLAVSMLWLTSLQVAVGIMDAYISTPTMTAVIKSCDHSYNVVSEERIAFGECVAVQLTSCNTQLTTAYIEETSKVASYESSNAAHLLAMQRRFGGGMTQKRTYNIRHQLVSVFNFFTFNINSEMDRDLFASHQFD